MKHLSKGKQRLERKVYRKEEPQLLSVHSPAVRHRDSTRRSANKRDPPVLQRSDKCISVTSSPSSKTPTLQVIRNARMRLFFLATLLLALLAAAAAEHVVSLLSR